MKKRDLANLLNNAAAVIDTGDDCGLSARERADLVDDLRQAADDMGRRFALLSKQGTACAETVLTADEYTPENRAIVERTHCTEGDDSPQPGTWTDVTDNEACG